ncbi:MAG: hypothetical protein AAF074_17010 [Pseudomonadota bacterium]
MLTKIALTLAIAAVVFLLGARFGGRAAERENRRVRRRGAGGEAGKPARVPHDLVQCPRCGAYHAAGEICRCGR